MGGKRELAAGMEEWLGMIVSSWSGFMTQHDAGRGIASYVNPALAAGIEELEGNVSYVAAGIGE